MHFLRILTQENTVSGAGSTLSTTVQNSLVQPRKAPWDLIKRVFSPEDISGTYIDVVNLVRHLFVA